MRIDAGKHREVEYRTNEATTQALCEAEPTFHLSIERRVVTTEIHEDGSETVHTTPWRQVRAWTYKHDERETA